MVLSQPWGSQHPGRVLNERFLKPRGITPYGLAKTLHITESTVNDFIEGRSALTVGLAIRLSRLFDLSAQEWIAIQRNYDNETSKNS